MHEDGGGGSPCAGDLIVGTRTKWTSFSNGPAKKFLQSTGGGLTWKGGLDSGTASYIKDIRYDTASKSFQVKRGTAIVDDGLVTSISEDTEWTTITTATVCP